MSKRMLCQIPSVRIQDKINLGDNSQRIIAKIGRNVFSCVAYINPFKMDVCMGHMAEKPPCAIRQCKMTVANQCESKLEDVGSYSNKRIVLVAEKNKRV